MKVIVQQEILAKLLAKGGLAALTDEAQADSTGLAPLIQSVKITVGTDFSVESAVPQLITKCSVPATSDNGIEVKEAGEVVVSAKELLTWVGSQVESKIGLSLSKLDVPETVETKDADMEAKTGNVKKIGTLKVTSKDNTKTGTRWALDAYDPTQLPKLRIGTKLDNLFEIDAKNLKMVLDFVTPSAQKSDNDHVYDSMVVQNTKDGLYVGTTDTKRCTIYRLEKTVENKGAYFDPSGSKLLIPIKTLLATIKAADEGKFRWEYDPERKGVVLTQGGFEARISIPDSSVFGKFPQLDKLLDKKYVPLCSVSKDILVRRFITAGQVNSSSAKLIFVSANNEAKIFAVSDGGKAPITSTCPVEDLTMDYDVVWGVQHIIDFCKLIKDSKISFMVPEDNKGTHKIISSEDPNLVFFAMSPINPKYDNVGVGAE